MTREPLCLYALDRPALRAFSDELRAALADDDGARLAALLELGDALATKVRGRQRLVELFLRPEDDAEAAPLWAPLRRIAKKRSLTLVLRSSSLALEGRLRGYELLREDAALADAVDKLLDPRRLPWFLQRDGASCGWLDGPAREALAQGLAELRPALTPELCELADALAGIDADAVLHDRL